MSLKNFKNRYKIWKIWRKNNKNSKFHQWLVLFKLRPSPTFDNFEVWYYIKEGFKMWERVWPEPTYIGLDKVNVLEEGKDYD